MNLERRVVVTGLGVCTPLGFTVPDFMQRLYNGESSVGDVKEYKPELANGYKSQVGSYFRPEQVALEYLGINNIDSVKPRTSIATKIALCATRQAVEQSGIFNASNLEELKERTGVCIAAGFGGISDLEAATISSYFPEEARRFGKRFNPFLAVSAIPGATSAFLSQLYELHAGAMMSPAAACASGAVSIVQGFRDIQDNLADAYVVGGTGDFSVVSFAAFDKLRALSTRFNDRPFKASRPFDKERDGFVFGDGSGVLIIEELEHAKKRGAEIYAEMLGYGLFSDGSDFTAPRKDGKYGIKAMQMALEMARINPEQIDYINAHGTSTPLNDPTESGIIKEVLKGHYYRPLVNSTKSMIGHTLNAAGSIEALVTVMAIHTNTLHQTKNLEDVDAECDLNFLKDKDTREIKSGVNYAASNSFAFGGRNACLVFGKYSKNR